MFYTCLSEQIIKPFPQSTLTNRFAISAESFKGSGLKLSADMAKFIVESGQKECFAEYQQLKDEINKNLER